MPSTGTDQSDSSTSVMGNASANDSSPPANGDRQVIEALLKEVMSLKSLVKHQQTVQKDQPVPGPELANKPGLKRMWDYNMELKSELDKAQAELASEEPDPHLVSEIVKTCTDKVEFRFKLINLAAKHNWQVVDKYLSLLNGGSLAADDEDKKMMLQAVSEVEREGKRFAKKRPMAQIADVAPAPPAPASQPQPFRESWSYQGPGYPQQAIPAGPPSGYGYPVSAPYNAMQQYIPIWWPSPWV